MVFVLAAVLLLPRSAWPRREYLGRYVACGVSMFGNVFLLLLGLSLTTASTASMLQVAQPIWASVLAAAMGHERLTRQKVAGVATCIAGSLVVTVSRSGTASRVDMGALVILLQTISGANYVVQQRPLVQAGCSPLIVSSCSYVIATMLTLIVGVTYFATVSPDVRSHVQWWDDSPYFSLFFLYVVLLTTVFNYVAIAWATGVLGATVVTLFILLQGILCCAFEWLFFGTPVDPYVQVGGAILAAGLTTIVFPARFCTAPPPTSSAPLVEGQNPCPERAAYVSTREAWAASLLAALPCSQDRVQDAGGAQEARPETC